MHTLQVQLEPSQCLMFVLKEVTLGSSLRQFGRVFHIWLPRKDTIPIHMSRWQHVVLLVSWDFSDWSGYFFLWIFPSWRGNLHCLKFYKFQSSGVVNSVHESSVNCRSQEGHHMLRYKSLCITWSALLCNISFSSTCYRYWLCFSHAVILNSNVPA